MKGLYSTVRTGSRRDISDRLRVGWVPREQKMLKGHLPRVRYHRVYFSIRKQERAGMEPGSLGGRPSQSGRACPTDECSPPDAGFTVRDLYVFVQDLKFIYSDFGLFVERVYFFGLRVALRVSGFRF
jgi:hypothetical protein